MYKYANAVNIFKMVIFTFLFSQLLLTFFAKYTIMGMSIF